MEDKGMERACMFLKNRIERLRREEIEAQWNFSDYKNNLEPEQWYKVQAAFYHVSELFEQEDTMLEEFYGKNRTVPEHDILLRQLEDAIIERKVRLDIFKAELALHCPEYEHEVQAHMIRDEAALASKKSPESMSMVTQASYQLSGSELLESLIESIFSDDDRCRLLFAHDIVQMHEVSAKEQMRLLEAKAKGAQQELEKKTGNLLQSMNSVQTELEVTKAKEQDLFQKLTATKAKLDEFSELQPKYQHLKSKFSHLNDTYQAKKTESESLKVQLEKTIASYQSALESKRQAIEKVVALTSQLDQATVKCLSISNDANEQLEKRTAEINSLKVQLHQVTTQVAQYKKDLDSAGKELTAGQTRYQKEHEARLACERNNLAEKEAHTNYQGLYNQEIESRRAVHWRLMAKKHELAKVTSEKVELESQLAETTKKWKHQKELKEKAVKHYTDAFGDDKQNQDNMQRDVDTTATRGPPNIIPRPNEPLPPQEDLPEKPGYFSVRSHYRAKRGNKLQSP